ncbi:toll/interleukin-1 receptor domain-containing protein [Acetobacter malorum]|uniref:toll/interleukin-1 receptor domain-containing protein n=1 Tax=Acetobacter malorum TaxID=178901 RepID=UPI000A3B9A0F|nr:toll/interleukin-1 receptor domain-containing protein [Acetobacter malorum]
MNEKTPKVFISYTWSSQEHKEWVKNLADELIENGIDIVLDQYDLHEGDDMNHFMEKSIADKTIDRIIVICDKNYVEKANQRKGGAGFEAGIISQEVASQIESPSGGKKICGVVVDVDNDGNYCLPTYLKAHLAINMIGEGRYTNSEQLVRWVYNKPALKKPELGSRPSFLDNEKGGVSLHTRGLSINARIAFEHGKPNAFSALNSYLDKLEEGLAQFESLEEDPQELKNDILEKFNEFIPYKDEFLNVIKYICLSETVSTRSYDRIRSFFQNIYSWKTRSPSNNRRWYRFHFANFDLYCYELFLSTIAFCVKYEAFDFLKALLKQDYILEQRNAYRGERLYSFAWFCPENENISAICGSSEKKYTRIADMILQRGSSVNLTYQDFLSADLFLLIIAQTKLIDLSPNEAIRRFPWYCIIIPGEYITLPSVDLFTRCQSLEFVERLAASGGTDPQTMRRAVERYSETQRSLSFLKPEKWGTLS